MSAALHLENLTRRYAGGGGVEGVNLVLQPGEVTALLGASGAGKTTLLRLIAGFETPESGTLKRGDTLLAGDGVHVPAERRRIGLIFQDFALFPHLTARANVTFGLQHKGKAQAARLADDWLAKLDLSARANAYPAELSGGEQQRVAIARALAPQPHALLMDEAFSGLDPALGESVRTAAFAAIRAAGIPALLVTHDPVEALAEAARIAILSRGRLVQAGRAHDVWFHPASEIAAEALGPVNRLKPDGEIAQRFVQARGARAVLLRPEGVHADPAGAFKGRVLDVRGAGPYARLEIEIGGERLVARGLQVPVTIGEVTNFRLDPALLFTFPSGDS